MRPSIKERKEVNISFKADQALNLKFLEILNDCGLSKSDWLRVFIENEWEKLQKMKLIINKKKKALTRMSKIG